MSRDHMLGGAAFWLPGCAILHTSPTVTVAGAGMAVAGALAPDVDHRSADAAQAVRYCGTVLMGAGVWGYATGGTGHPGPWRIPLVLGVCVFLVPWALRPRHGKYRGVTHSLIGLAVMTVLAALGVVFGLPGWAGAAFMAGWVSHLVLDGLTKEGLPLVWPGKLRFGWTRKAESIITGGRRRSRKQSKNWLHRRRTLVTWYAEEGERLLVRPALLVVIAVCAAWIMLGGGHVA